MAKFPARAGDIDDVFLTKVLGADVLSYSIVPIGDGLVGDSARISLQYADLKSGPATIVAKFPAADQTSRNTGVSLQLYEKEVGFYQQVAPHIGTRIPKVFFAEHDAESSDFLLLMEDCGPAVQGNQLTSCTLNQAKAAILALAALHGPTFQNSSCLSLPFLAPNDGVRNFVAAHYPGASEKFRSTYDGKIPPDILTYICGLADHAEEYFLGSIGNAPCVVHGDFRLDNMLFDICDGVEPVAILDWQTVTAGHPLSDLGYFMGSGIGTELRRANEITLLEVYRLELIAHGGPDLGDIRGSTEYARGTLSGISTAVFSAAFVENTQRSEAIFRSMAIGAAELAMEIDAMRVLEAHNGS